MKMYLSLFVLIAGFVMAHELCSRPKGKKNNKTKQTDDAFLKQTCVAIWYFINAFSIFILFLCFMHWDDCVSDNRPWHAVWLARPFHNEYKITLPCQLVKNPVDIFDTCLISLWICGLNVRFICGVLGKYGISWVYGVNLQDHRGYLA